MNARARRRVNPFSARQLLTPIAWIPVAKPPDAHSPEWEMAHQEVAAALHAAQTGAYGHAARWYAEAECLMQSGNCSAIDLAHRHFDEAMFWHRRRTEDAPGNLAKALERYESAESQFDLAPDQEAIDPLDLADLAFNIAACQEDIAAETRRESNKLAGAKREAARAEANLGEFDTLAGYQIALEHYEAAGAAPLDRAWVYLTRGNCSLKRFREAGRGQDDSDRALHDLERGLVLLGVDLKTIADGRTAEERAASLARELGAEFVAAAAQGMMHLANHRNMMGDADSVALAWTLQRTALAIYHILVQTPIDAFEALDRIRTAELTLARWAWKGNSDPATAHAQAEAALGHVDGALDAFNRMAMHPRSSWEDVLTVSEQCKTSAQHAVAICVAMSAVEPAYDERAFAYVQQAKGIFARALAARSASS